MNARIDMTNGPALTPNAWLRFDIVRQTLERVAPSRVLEIGPGSGAMAARLVAAGHDYVGVELSETSREVTREVVGAIPGGSARVEGSIDGLESEAPFDLLCAFEVIEHIEDDQAAVTEWVRLLRPGAQVIFSVPAWQSRYSYADIEVGHIRRYSPEEFANLATAAGLVDVKVTVYGFGLGDVLELARNQISRRRQAKQPVEHESAIERTKRSGRFFQPPRWTNRAVQTATWPFRMLQRQFPRRGPGLILTARTPAAVRP